MNLVISIGNLTDEPKANEYGEHKKVTFTLALNRMKEGADFVRFTAWDKKAEVIEKHCHKGMKIRVNSHVQSGSYEKDGKKVYTTDFVVDEIEFLEKKKEQEPPEGYGKNESEEFMHIPEGIDEEMPFK